MPASRIAVLFDAENCAADAVAPVLQQLRLRGTVCIRRAIGDFSGSLLAPWVQQARLCGIELIMQPSLGRGKNSADIMLAVEAMDILHGGAVGAIALVSSDRDFTPLALRLRRSGLDVLGFGRAGTDGA
ncbi:MAG TPA: NYN domain-containing protein, partial [Devosia sp.]|nr:NYN domain-containing protein [Devosia sp.]